MPLNKTISSNTKLVSNIQMRLTFTRIILGQWAALKTIVNLLVTAQLYTILHSWTAKTVGYRSKFVVGISSHAKNKIRKTCNGHEHTIKWPQRPYRRFTIHYLWWWYILTLFLWYICFIRFPYHFYLWIIFIIIVLSRVGFRSYRFRVTVWM